MGFKNKLKKFFSKNDKNIFNGFEISIRGYSHEVNSLPCQDSSLSYCCKDYSIAVVADGHGSEKHFRSDTGSKIATEVSINAINQFMKDRKNFDRAMEEDTQRVFRRIESNILLNWNKNILKHYNENPLTETEQAIVDKNDGLKIESIYGTTLILAVLTKDYWYGMQIGDGSMVSIYEDGTVKKEIPEDDRLIVNFTTSLCDNNAISNFRNYYSQVIPSAIIVSTDGFINSFSNEESFFRFNEKILIEMEKNPDSLENLEEHLHKRSEKGSQDDISVAGIYFKNFAIKKLT